MRQRHSCISHGNKVEHNALRSWHATMYKFVTSMVLCGLGMQQCAMHNEAIQKTTFFELGVYQPRSQALPSPERNTLVGSSHVAPRFWVVTNKINVADVLKIDSCSYLT